MKQSITKRGLFAIAAKTIDEKRPQVVALMQRYGVAINDKDDTAKIDAAFLALIRTSRGFRRDFSNLAVGSAKDLQNQYTNASGHLNFLGFGKKKKTTSSPSTGASQNVPTKEESSTTTTKPPFYPTPTGSAPTETDETTSSVTPKEKGKFGSWLGSVFDAPTLQNVINTGLGIWSYQKTGGSVSPITQGRQDYSFNTGTGTGTGSGDGKSGGMGIGAIVGLSLLGIGIVGIVIYSVTKGGKGK